MAKPQPPPDQSTNKSTDNRMRKRRLSKRERKNLKKKKTQADDNEATLTNEATSKPGTVEDDGTSGEPTLEQYMANYTPSPLTKHLSKQEEQAADSLGKWFPKATVIKSSVCYTNDYLASLKKKKNSHNDNNIQEPKASLVLFYQYVNPTWSTAKVSAFTTYISNIIKSHRSNLGGRMRISTEGVNCTISSASTTTCDGDAKFQAAQTLRHFIQDMVNFDKEAFASTDFKYIDGLDADRHFKEMKILPVKELVFYGIREDIDDAKNSGDAAATSATTTAVIPKNAQGGIHLEAKEYHEMLKKNDAVVIDVRNHYEAAIGRFDGQMIDDGDTTKDDGKGENKKGGAKYIDPKMRKSTDFTSWLEEPETKQKLEGKTVMMFCTGGIRCERASAYLNSKMGSELKGVYQLKGGIERYLQAFPDGGFWRGKNFVFDKREAIGAGNVNGDGGVVCKKNLKEAAADGGGKLLPWGTECANCKKPWDRYVGKRKCFTCGSPIILCDDCMSQSSNHKKKSKRKNDKQSANDEKVNESVNKSAPNDASLDKVRCPLCVEEGITVPADQVEYTDNGVRSKQRSDSFSEGGQESNVYDDPSCKERGNVENGSSAFDKIGGEIKAQKAAKSVLKWGGGHASKKKEKRKYSKKLCQFGVECVRKDCFFYHPERNSSSK